jgi:hypothetical protein
MHEDRPADPELTRDADTSLLRRPWVWAVLGLVLLTLGVVSVAVQEQVGERIAASWTSQAAGVVEDTAHYRSGGRVEIAFDVDGEPQRQWVYIPAGTSIPRVGSQVTVRYDPDDPTSAGLDGVAWGSHGTTLLAAVLFAGGLVALGAAAVSAWSRRRSDTPRR